MKNAQHIQVNPTAPLVEQRRYARATEAARYLKISKSTLWRWVQELPGFPKPIKIGPRVTLFDLTAIDELLQGKGGE